MHMEKNQKKYVLSKKANTWKKEDLRMWAAMGSQVGAANDSELIKGQQHPRLCIFSPEVGHLEL